MEPIRLRTHLLLDTKAVTGEPFSFFKLSNGSRWRSLTRGERKELSSDSQHGTQQAFKGRESEHVGVDDFPAVVSLIQVVTAALLLHVIPARQQPGIKNKTLDSLLPGPGAPLISQTSKNKWKPRVRSNANPPGEVVLQDPHEDDDDEAEQQHHQHQRVDDGQPVNLQCFGEEGVVPEALASPPIRQAGHVPVHAVGVRDRQAAPAHSHSTHRRARPLLQGKRLDVFHRDVGEDHGVTVVLDVEVQVSPQPHLTEETRGEEAEERRRSKRGFPALTLWL